MFGVAFTNPLMWAGILAASIPILIHLLTRRTPVKVVFPTIRFLRSAKANQSRLFRIRHILLLILRTAIILLVLAAFLRPVYQRGALAQAPSDASGTAAIIILDTSLSMGYTNRGIRSFTQAQVAAQEILDHLSEADAVNLILAGAIPRAVFDEPKQNRHQLRSEIEQTEVELGFGNMDAALGMALEQLADMDDYKKEIHLVSDFQRTNWAAVNFAAIPENIQTVFVTIGEEERGNTALTEVTISPASPTVSEEVEILCKVVNYSTRPWQGPLELSFGDETRFERQITLAPGATRSASFRLRLNRSGIYEGILSIPEDSLHADDRRVFALRATERFPITVVSDQGTDAPSAAHRFINMALDPSIDESAIYVPNLIRSQALDKYAVGQSPIVILSQIDTLSAATIDTLLDYLREGGSVVYFLSSLADKANLIAMSAAAEGDLELPFNVGRLIDVNVDTEANFASLQSANYDDRMLKKFRESGALAELLFYRYFTTTRNEAQGQVLLRYGNSHIALARKTLGLGTLLLANFSPDLDGSDMAKHTVFLPFIHEMMNALRLKSGGDRQYTVGYACSTSIRLADKTTPLRFTNPSNEEMSAIVDLNGDEGWVIFSQTDQTGFYRVHADTLVGSIPVNVDRRESNLDSLNVKQLQDLTRTAQDQFFASAGSDMQSLRRLREGLPMWHYFLIAALAFLALEQLAALAWKR